MHTILLQPNDVLFFRDGRPMSGSLSGHGAAWPLPTVINHAYHAALHRAEFTGLHKHLPGRSSATRDFSETNLEKSGRLFGSLATSGPFPVKMDAKDGHASQCWFFPRPQDAGAEQSTKVTFQPLAEGFMHKHSSLPEPLLYAVANTQPPSKAAPEAWLSASAFSVYLAGAGAPTKDDFARDGDFSDTEHSVGIGLDDETSTQDLERFYSASYLRLREGWRLGTLAVAEDRTFRDREHGNDLIRSLFNGKGNEIIAGGQQRVCRAEFVRASHAPLPLPQGLSKGFSSGEVETVQRWLVKWVLLTPAVFPRTEEGKPKSGKPIHPHPGGWLPNWIHPQSGQVMLKAGDTARRTGERRDHWRQRVAVMDAISARLVAAMVGKPIPVTGYALPTETDPERAHGGAKSTHLAVPSGAVYYFAAESEQAATQLASALNWHGSGDLSTIRNRRSTLFGEKGFGLGVCGKWTFHSGERPAAS